VDPYEHRREVYEAEVPDGVLALTAGIDVHEYALNYEVVGWGVGNESWGIEYGILDGDPREQDVWDLLDEAVFKRLFTCSDGKQMRVRKMAVDSGYASDFVYVYTKPRQPRAISIKGEGGLGKPFIKGIGTLTKSNSARLITIGVDTGKEEIVNRLMVSKPGPGYCHFPKLANGEACRGYDEEYFKGLTAEHRIVKSKHGFRTYIWIKRLSQRNEPFDCRNYALAAMRMPMSGIKLDKMKRDVFEPPKDTEGKTPFGVQGTMLTKEAGAPAGRTTHGTPPSKFGVQNRGVS
jgi:phage terminase large subunit GpA-like protein